MATARLFYPGAPPTRTADADAEEIVGRRHCDWRDHDIAWRWLLDSYEGGNRYRSAVYGMDGRGMHVRNLIRHRREYPERAQALAIPPYALFGSIMPGSVAADPSATASDDDYEMRRARTPVPGWVAEAASIHLGKIYDQEVAREGPTPLQDWWSDVDGKGTDIGDYMRETIAPLLLVLGCLDVVIDRPPVPEGETVRTSADEMRLGLDRVIAGYILPQNMVWWRCDRMGQYVECLVREYEDPSERDDVTDRKQDDWEREYLRYRHWTGLGWVLYNADGSEVLALGEHPYGRPPIVRLIDTPLHRCPHIGQSRYAEVADLQRQYYNVDSELTLSNTLQAHPSLSGPEEYCQEATTVPVGPGNVLPMKWREGGYQSWEYVSPPKDPAMSLSDKLRDLEDRKDRAACLAKPAGAVTGSTTAQSGISKQLDAVTGHKMLSSIAKSLRKAERQMAGLAMYVLRGFDEDIQESIYVEYPSKFELFSAQELLDGAVKLQLVASQSGDLPRIEGEILRQTARRLNPGLKAEEYALMDEEIQMMLESRARVREQMRELAPSAFGGNNQGDQTD